MDEPHDLTRMTLEQIQKQLDESDADLAAGRVSPAEVVLTEMIARAKERMEAKARTKALKKVS